MNTIADFSGMNIEDNSDTGSDEDSFDANDLEDNSDTESGEDFYDPDYASDSSHYSYDSDVSFHGYYPGGLSVAVTIRATHNRMIVGFMKELYKKGREGGYWQLADIALREIVQRSLHGLPTDHTERQIPVIKTFTIQNRKYLDFYKEYEHYVLGFIDRYANDNSIGQEATAQMLFLHYSGGDAFYFQVRDLDEFNVHFDESPDEDITG